MSKISSDYALLATLSLDQVRQVRDHILEKIGQAFAAWRDLAELAAPELDDQILKIFEELDKLEDSLETVELYLERSARPSTRRAA